MAKIGHCHPVRAEDGEGLLAFCGEHDFDLVVIGPEAPLVAGVADELRHLGVAVFGPGAAAARIEGSKSFAKELMAAAGVPIAEALPVARAPCVIKADGLAAGKGVFVCRDQGELEAALQAAAAFGDSIVIEELLEGEEISVFALCDGVHAVALPTVQDFKRIGEGDTGPNTGGMGSYSPVAVSGPSEAEELVDAIHRPVIEELAFHAGTALQGDRLVTSGGRILNVTATGPNVAAARDQAYEACELISFPGMRYRRDIATVTHV